MSAAVGGSAPVNPRPRCARGGTVFFMVFLRPLAVCYQLRAREVFAFLGQGGYRQTPCPMNARLRLTVPARPFVEDCPNDHSDNK